MALLTVCLLNLHEDERLKPRNWVPVGWIPVYDENRDTPPDKGFDSTSARKYRLYHACWIEFLDRWAERTKDPRFCSVTLFLRSCRYKKDLLIRIWSAPILKGRLHIKR